MRYNLLGRSGLAVSELCLGTMTFGGSEGMWGVIRQLQQDEVDGCLSAEQLQSLTPVGGEGDPVGPPLELHLDDAPDVRLVVDHEDVVFPSRGLGLRHP